MLTSKKNEMSRKTKEKKRLKYENAFKLHVCQKLSYVNLILIRTLACEKEKKIPRSAGLKSKMAKKKKMRSRTSETFQNLSKKIDPPHCRAAEAVPLLDAGSTVPKHSWKSLDSLRLQA